jgi:GTP-binding protein
MKVTSARFVKSALKPEHYPRDGYPEFAFVGRSNVGKSTLLNTILRRRHLAETSKTPGKTRTINFFLINEKIFFVDLPGYGYAKVSKALKGQWNREMMAYLSGRENLRMAALLLDGRHKPARDDLRMLELLDEAEKPTLIIATKIDKLKRSQRKKQLDTIRASLELDEDALILPFSSVTREGVRELWRVISDLV